MAAERAQILLTLGMLRNASREERHDDLTATVKGIVDKEKSVQDSKTEKLRKLREARDAAPTAPGTSDTNTAKKRKTTRSIPVDKLTSQNDT